MQGRSEKVRIFGKKLLEFESLEMGLDFISQTAKELVGADRCSIFMHNAKNDELWSMYADATQKITMPSDMGIVGHTIRIKKPIIDNDPYDSTYFLPDVDMQTGYYTQNILTSPIFDSKKEIVGVIELLNKKGGFSKEDMEFLSFFAHYVSGYIELFDASE